MDQFTRITFSSLVRFQDFAAGLQTQSVILADHQQSITWANLAALQLHGVERAEQLGATISEYAANFRLKYTEAVPPDKYGSGRHGELCEGALQLAPAGDEHASVQCRMQLFEVAAPGKSNFSTAMVLQSEANWPDATAPPRHEQPGILHKTSSARLAFMTENNPGAERSIFALPHSEIDVAPPLTDIATTRRRQMITEARTICAVVPIALYVLDSGMRILCVTDAWLNWLGYNAPSVIGRDIGLFVDAETRIRFEQQAWARLRDIGFTDNIRCRFVKRSGEAVDAIVAASATVDEAGELAYITCVPVEIESHQHDDGLMRLIGLSPTPTLCWQLDNASVRQANQAFHTIMGHPVASLMGQNLDDLGLWETRFARQKAEQELGLSGALQRQDFRLRTSTGEVLICAASVGLIRLSGHACGVIMLQDVTDRRRDEAQLFEALEAVMTDSTWFSRAVLEKLAMLRSPRKTYGRQAELAELTRREREVLTMISVGQGDLEIARQLGLTRSTVRNHVATLYSKIDVHSRSAAIVWARERGINLTMSKVSRGNGRAVAL